jgi:predicted transcriptional regulator
MELGKIVELVGGKIITSSRDASFDIQRICTTDMMSDVLRFARRGELLITSLNQPQVVRTAEIADIPVVMVVLGKKIEKEMIEMAEKMNITLISTGLPMFTACGMLYSMGLRSCVDG